MNSEQYTISLESFGYLHQVPAGDGYLVDVRHCLRDPHVDPAMRQMTGLDNRVSQNVMRQPGAHDLVTMLGRIALGIAQAHDGDARVLIGCQGGRHRSVALVRALAGHLALLGVETEVIHHHVTRPVVERP